jgi:uncharacterized membrane protein SirB2
MFRNASTFELLWTVMSMIGLCIYVVLGWFAFGDRRYLRGPNPTPADRRALTSRQIIATMNISVSLLLGGIDVSLMSGGIFSMLIPPSTPAANRTLTATAIVLLVSLFMVHVFLIAVALVLFVARTRLLAKVEADREHIAAISLQMGLDDDLESVTHMAARQNISRNENSSALRANTEATNAATHALQNGPLAAQIAQTEATTDLTTATVENSDVIRISTEVELKKLDGEGQV